MSNVNIVPLGRVSFSGGGFRPSFRKSTGDQIALAQQQIAAQTRAGDADRQLRELALLLGASQTQDSLAVTREQITQQGDQFTRQLDVAQSESAAERGANRSALELQIGASAEDSRLGRRAISRDLQRGLQGAASSQRTAIRGVAEQSEEDDRRLADRNKEENDRAQKRLEDQLKNNLDLLNVEIDARKDLEEDNKKHRNAERQLGELAAGMRNLTIILGSEAAEGLAIAKDEADAARAAMDGVTARFTGRVRLIESLAGRTDDDNIEGALRDIEEHVRGLLGDLRDTLNDESLSGDQRTGVAAFLVTPGAVFAGQQVPQLQSLMLNLLELRGEVGSAGKDRINRLVKDIGKMEADLLPGSMELVTLFKQTLVPLESDQAIIIQSNKRIGARLTEREEIVQGGDVSRRFDPLEDIELRTPRGDTTEFDKVLARLSSGPGAASRGGQSQLDPNATLFEQETGRRQASDQARRSDVNARQEPKRFEVLAQQNRQAIASRDPNAVVNIVNQNGNTVTLPVSKLTGAEIERLRKAGFRIPGVD